MTTILKRERWVVCYRTRNGGTQKIYVKAVSHADAKDRALTEVSAEEMGCVLWTQRHQGYRGEL